MPEPKCSVACLTVSDGDCRCTVVFCAMLCGAGAVGLVLYDVVWFVLL